MKTYLKQKSKGFSLIELIIAIIIVALLVSVVFAGGSAMIKSAKKSRAKSDLHNFDIALSSWIGENLKIINTSDNSGYSNVSSKLITKLNEEFPEDYKIKELELAEIPNFFTIQQANSSDNYYIYQSERLDPWENPYYIILSNANRNGDANGKKYREFFITVVSAGPNSQTAIDTTSSEIDNDDIFLLVQCTNGNLYSEIYDCSETQPLTNTENIASSYISLTAGLPVVRAYSSVLPTNDSSISDPFGGGGNVSPTPQPTPSTISFQIKLGAERTEIFDNVPENYTWNDFINESSIKLAYNTKVEDGKIVFTVNDIKYIIKNISASNTLVNNGIYVGEKQIEIASLSTVLTFSSPEAFTLATANGAKNWDGTLEYSEDLSTWSTWDGTTTLNSASQNGQHVIYLRGTGNSIITGNASSKWVLEGSNISCTGNIENLRDYTDGEHPVMGNFCYMNMFNGCTSLTTAPELPATTLADYCYMNMFRGCTGLTTAPELPATTLVKQCYYFMFYNCTSLTTAPELPATTLASRCYERMFGGCTGLTTAPELPATTLADSCYGSMFYGCTGLTTAPELPATTLASRCYQDMFYGCTNLTTAPELPATTLASRCYQSMFSGCTSLTTAPELPATTLADYSYNSMFYRCTSLTTAPELPATTLVEKCYGSMFSGCTSIKLSGTQTGNYAKPYRIPTTGEGTTATDALTDMFANTGGTFTGTPEINTTYYLWCEGHGTDTNGDYKCDNCGQYILYDIEDMNNVGAGAVFSFGTMSVTKDGVTTALTMPTNPVFNGNLYSYTTSSQANNIKDYYNATSITFGDSVDDKKLNWVKASDTLYICDRNLWNYISYDDLDTLGYGETDNTVVTIDGQAFKVRLLADTEWTSYVQLYSTNGSPYYWSNCYSWTSTLQGQNRMLRGCDSSGSRGDAGPSVRDVIIGFRPVLELLTGGFDYYDDYDLDFDDDYDYLKFSSTEAFTLATANSAKNWDGTLEYCNSADLSTWSTWDGTAAISSSDGEAPVLYIRGTGNTKITGNSSNYSWALTGSNISCTGNIESLLDYNTVADGNHPTMNSYAFAYLFKGCTSLTTAPELPATTLIYGCYNGMFTGCTGLTIAPELKATTLANYCYSNMFYGCTGLTTAPELKATTLANYCYSNMFYGCTGLTTAPALPATTLASHCYNSMFRNCTSLTTAPELSATTLKDYCYSYMFTGCTSLTTAPALPATTLADSCYSNMFYGCAGLTTAPALPATTLASSCYSYMFRNCTGLTTAPELSATTLADFCYSGMFRDCTSLTTAPALPATTLADGCYDSMFSGCTSIKLSTTQTGEYTIPYRIPTSGTGTTATNALMSMFSGTEGDFKGTPKINTTYYLSSSNSIVS